MNEYPAPKPQLESADSSRKCNFVESLKEQAAVATSTAKRIYRAIKCTWDQFTVNNLKVSVTFDDICTPYRSMKDLMTNTPIAGTQDDGENSTQVVDGKIIYNDSRISEIGIYIDNLKNLLFKVQHEINRN